MSNYIIPYNPALNDYYESSDSSWSPDYESGGRQLMATQVFKQTTKTTTVVQTTEQAQVAKSAPQMKQQKTIESPQEPKVFAVIDKNDGLKKDVEAIKKIKIVKAPESPRDAMGLRTYYVKNNGGKGAFSKDGV